jgi:uncharacterized membrane protein YdcZ (DUF606 family)
VSHDNEADFITRSLDAVDDVFDRFHDVVLRPLFLVGRTVAYAAVLVTFGTVALVAGLLGLARLLDSYVFSAHRWLTPFSVGIALVLVGLWLWRRRRPTTSS